MKILEGEKLNIINNFAKQGDTAFDKGDFKGQLEFYKKAWNAIPEPKKDWDVSDWIMGSIAEAYYLQKDYDTALKYFLETLKCINGERGFINFRIGQIYFNKDEIDNATKYFQKAWDLSEGRAFQDEDSKYLYFLKK
jgi:tetratricopeptide (TPR) repeat protein